MVSPSSTQPTSYGREKSIAELQALIDYALASGISEMTFDDIIAEARAQADAEADLSRTRQLDYDHERARK